MSQKKAAAVGKRAKRGQRDNVNERTIHNPDLSAAKRRRMGVSVHKRFVWAQIGIWLSTFLIVGTVSYLYQCDVNTIISNLVMALLGVSMLILEEAQAAYGEEFAYDNAKYPLRFFVVYIIGLAVACILPLLPVGGWPYPAIGVMLAFFSNTLIGIVGSALLMMISVSLAGAPASVFFLYFLATAAAILLFRKLDESYKFGVPFILSLTLLFVATTAEVLLFLHERLSVETVIIPIINLFVSGLLLLSLLKFFSKFVVHRYRDVYMVINDQEFRLMSTLKERERDTYFHAIHCAYLCERIAGRMGLSIQLAKAGGYYHRIAVLTEGKDIESVLRLTEEHHFPPEVCDLLVHYMERKGKPETKEETILYFADAVITEITRLIRESEGQKVDYKKCIFSISWEKLANGTLANSRLRLQEFYLMQKILIEESLYYDFLR